MTTNSMMQTAGQSTSQTCGQGDLRPSHGLSGNRALAFVETMYFLPSARQRLRFRHAFRFADNPGTIAPCNLGARCLTARTCKACASSPGGQELAISVRLVRLIAL